VNSDSTADRCEQIIAIRLNDVRHDTNVVDGVLQRYQSAWEKKGMVAPDGLLKDMWLVKQDCSIIATDPAFSAWAGAYMNSWNSEFVRANYERQAHGFLTTIDGETKIHPIVVGNAYRTIANDQKDSDKSPREILSQALEVAKTASAELIAARSHDNPSSLFTRPTIGCVAQWLSELGKPELEGLVKFADTNLNPTWDHGGLFYPRNDAPMDEALNWTHMDPFSGNASFGYAKLNVENGTKAWWERPWTKHDVRGRPSIQGVTLADGVDFLRGIWDEEKNLVVVTMRTWDAREAHLSLAFQNLSVGQWQVYVDSQLLITSEAQQGGEIVTDVKIGEVAVDVVIVKRT
jgi:hypothetical protein